MTLSSEEGGQLSPLWRERPYVRRSFGSSLKSKLPIIIVTLAMSVSPPRTVVLIMTLFAC